MAIVTVSTSNTFNEWRVVTNQLVTEVNKTESGTAVLVANTITANTITANSDVTVSGNTSITGTLGVTGNVTLAGELRGPATFTIDPAAVGDNTGTVVIKGNLQVDGSTTTINSTTLTIDDKNIVVASGAADNAAADGAGLVVDGSNASITYIASGDKFNINKALELNSTLSVAGNTNFDTGTLFIDTANDRVGIGTTSPSVRLHVDLQGSSEIDVARFQSSNGAITTFLDIGSDTSNSQMTFDVTGSSSGNYVFRSGGTNRVVFRSSGRVGIGTTSPDALLDVNGDPSTETNNSTAGVITKFRNIYTRSRANSAGISGGVYATQLFHASSGAEFEIYNADNYPLVLGTNSTERVRITSAGHVGIGTTSPRYNTTGATAGETTLTIFNSAQNGGGIELASATTTNTAAIGRLSWINTNNTDGTRAVAWIDALVSGTTSGAQGGSMRFGTKEDNTAHSVKMVITGAGNVGINQAAPSQKLSVVGTANSAYTSASGIVLDYQSSTVNVTYPIGFAWSSSIGTQASYWGMGLIPVTFASGTAHLGFYTQGAERMRISGGSLGLGTTSPTARLHVVDSGTANTSITEVQRLFYTATTTPAVGYGAGIALYTANADLPSGAQTRVVIAGIAESVTNSSEKTALIVTTPASAGSGSQTERFRITSDGRVGIAATSPSNILTVQADGTGASFADDGVGQLIIRGSSNTSKRLGLGIDTTNNRGVIQAQLYGTGTYPLALNPAGGSVMIGTTTEAGALTVSGKIRTLTGDIELDSGQVTTNSDANSLRLGVNGNEKARITSAGYLSIGNTNPGQVLSIAGATDGKGLGFGGATNNYGNIFGSYSSGDMMIATGLQGNTTVEGVTSSFGDGSMYRSAIRLSAFGGRGIEFFTNNTSTVARGTAITPNARMKIATDGKVGIGTTDPAYLLTLRGGSGFAMQMENSTDEGRGFRLIINGAGGGAGGTVGLNTTSSLYALTFGIDSVEKMRLTTSGYFGIGTTAPNSIFHVSTAVNNGPGSATRISTGFGAGRVVLHNQDNVGTGNKMGLVFAHAGDPGVAAVIGSYKESGTWRTGLQFYTNAQTGGDVDGITERMRLTADGKLGIGTTDPLATLSVTGDLYYTGTLVEPAGFRTINFPTEQRGATISRLEICQISRDFNDWSGAYLEIIVRHKSYHSGGYSRYNISYGYFLGAVVSCLEAEGRSPGRVYAGAEVTVAGDVRYTPIYLDIPTYFEFDVQVTYNTTEIAVGTTFSGSGQIKFTKTYSDGSGSGSFNFYQMTGIISGGTAIGTTAPATYGSGDNKLVVAGNLGGTYVSSTGTTLTIDGNGTNTLVTLYARYSDNFKIQSDSYMTFGTGGSPVERMRITSTGNVGIGTTNPSYGLHVTNQSSLDAARYIYIPHTGVSSGYGNTAISNIHVGSYLDLQHFSFTNAPAIFFNGRIKRSDFVGSGSGTPSSYNIIEPYFSGGNFSLISTVNGGISFNIGSWGGNSEIDLGDISSHSSYKGGHDGNSFVIRSTGANGLNMRPDAGDGNNSARAFFVNNSVTWAIMNNSGNLSFRSGATVGSDSGTQRMYLDTSGNMVIGGVLTENSSIALKENVNPITNALDYISQLVGVTYDRKDGSAKNRAGLIKEEVEKVLPNVVNDNGIQYTNIIAYLVESIKDLKKEIEDLKKG